MTDQPSVQVCLHAGCNKPLATKDRKFCSRACARLASRVDYGNCTICGSPLNGDQKVACSRKCANVFLSRNASKTRNPAEDVERMRVMWDVEGLSGSVIGKVMGFSKSKVVGIARRNHFADRPSPIKHNAAYNGQRSGRPRAPRRAGPTTLPTLKSVPTLPSVSVVGKPAAAPKPAPQPVTQFLYLSRSTCQWPTSQKRPWTFCCEAALFGESYCSEHCRKAYPNWQPKRKLAA